jgi:plasmid maintenance system antidote protein VapI
MAEFPPLEAAPDSPVLSEPLRDAIGQSGKPVRKLAKQAKVSEIVLQQFLDGERDLRLATAERLAQILGLKLVAS